MKKSYLGILALAALPPTIAAASQFHHVPGSICADSFSTSTSVMRAGTLVNWSTSSAPTFSCAIDVTSTTVSPITVDPSTARVDYVDGNGNASGGAVACQIAVITSTNTTVTSAWRYSCATSGGCTAPPTAFTGAGFLTIPDSIASTANVVGMVVNCTVPVWDANNGTSAVLGIGASTATP